MIRELPVKGLAEIELPLQAERLVLEVPEEVTLPQQ